MNIIQHMSTTSNTNTISCPTCGKQVPQGNLDLHQYSGRCREVPSMGTTESQAISIDDQVMVMDDDSSLEVARAQPQPQPTRNVNIDQEEVVCLLNDDGAEVQEEWSCPRCTLLNSIDETRCDACGGRRPPHLQNTNESSARTDPASESRSPDPVLHERLVQDAPLVGGQHRSGQRSDNLFQRSIGTGALIGGLVGGTSAFIRGESISSGTINGMLTGGVSGVIAAGKDFISLSFHILLFFTLSLTI